MVLKVETRELIEGGVLKEVYMAISFNLKKEGTIFLIYEKFLFSRIKILKGI
jgi:hypothetical protein